MLPFFSGKHTRGKLDTQHGYWFYGDANFEIHRGLGRLFVDSWDEEKKKNASVNERRMMDRAVHGSVKNWMKAHSIPHYHVKT